VDGEAGGRSLLGQDGQRHGCESEENLGRHDSASILQHFHRMSIQHLIGVADFRQSRQPLSGSHRSRPLRSAVTRMLRVYGRLHGS
jgi:hypothetical protein